MVSLDISEGEKVDPARMVVVKFRSVKKWTSLQRGEDNQKLEIITENKFFDLEKDVEDAVVFLSDKPSHGPLIWVVSKVNSFLGVPFLFIDLYSINFIREYSSSMKRTFIGRYNISQIQIPLSLVKIKFFKQCPTNQSTYSLIHGTDSSWFMVGTIASSLQLREVIEILNPPISYVNKLEERYLISVTGHLLFIFQNSILKIYQLDCSKIDSQISGPNYFKDFYTHLQTQNIRMNEDFGKEFESLKMKSYKVGKSDYVVVFTTDSKIIFYYSSSQNIKSTFYDLLKRDQSPPKPKNSVFLPVSQSNLPPNTTIQGINLAKYSDMVIEPSNFFESQRAIRFQVISKNEETNELISSMIEFCRPGSEYNYIEEFGDVRCRESDSGKYSLGTENRFMGSCEQPPLKEDSCLKKLSYFTSCPLQKGKISSIIIDDIPTDSKFDCSQVKTCNQCSSLPSCFFSIGNNVCKNMRDSSEMQLVLHKWKNLAGEIPFDGPLAYNFASLKTSVFCPQILGLEAVSNESKNGIVLDISSHQKPIAIPRGYTYGWDLTLQTPTFIGTSLFILQKTFMLSNMKPVGTYPMIFIRSQNLKSALYEPKLSFMILDLKRVENFQETTQVRVTSFTQKFNIKSTYFLY